MGFASRKYAKIWEIKTHEKYNEIKISTSKKDGDGGFEQDFSGFARFLGKAFEKSKSLKGNETIKLLEVETTNKYDKERETLYTNYIVWDFELAQKDGASKQNDNNNPPPMQPIDDTDLPF